MDTFSLIEPNLKFLDVFICDKIIKCLKDIDQSDGVFQTDLWKEYRKRHLPQDHSPFESFKFDEQLTNMYRCGYEGLFARNDYNKFTATKSKDFYSFQENVQSKHHGLEVSRNDGLVEVPKKVITFEHFKQRMLGPL